MAKYASILSLLTLMFQLQLYTGEATTITFENNCNDTVWPVIDSNSGATSNNSFPSGFVLLSGKSRTINIQTAWVGRFWGRTFCTTNSLTGNFSCKTGDCGTGKIDCAGLPYQHPVTLIEFSFGQIQNMVFYDTSVVNGYNLPVAVAPYDSSCVTSGCVFNLNSGCPDELKVINDQGTIGCRSPCDVFHTNESCCSNGDDCRRGSFSLASLIFKKDCPRAYSYALDDDTTTFSCSSLTSYVITFCPSPSLASVISEPITSTSTSASPSISPSISPSASTSPRPSSAHTINLRKNSTGPPPPSTGDSKRKHTSLLIGLPISAAISVLLLYGVWTYMRKRKVIKTSSSLEVSEIQNAVVDSLQFDLHTIQTATSNFSIDNKLGEGGFGEVYKGLLENGQEIAVKRLSKTSGQGVTEFKTEVVLVAKLRHNNLVKLLGYCVALEEKLLVYEYLTNSSLDKILFDKSREASLVWQTRSNIITGVARGLLYLHEDSPLKIIHRDLKSSNILLDKDMNPKISDFGLAKLFGVDQTQGDTKRIVGTYGYMAPEYAITGHYSVKSDVYSFGVIVLEIISGQRNRFFGRVQLDEALLHRAWRLWNEEKALGLVDTTLENNFPKEEVIKFINIGLLCIQEDAALRPRMTTIVAVLNGQSINLPQPKPPNFFGTTNNFDTDHNYEAIYTGSQTITNLCSRD